MILPLYFCETKPTQLLTGGSLMPVVLLSWDYILVCLQFQGLRVKPDLMDLLKIAYVRFLLGGSILRALLSVSLVGSLFGCPNPIVILCLGPKMLSGILFNLGRNNYGSTAHTCCVSAEFTPCGNHQGLWSIPYRRVV